MYSFGMETFLAVVRSQSLSKAAEELNLAQTTVSQRLRVLEQELGITLIERSKGIKQIRLTPAGEEFFKLANQWSLICRELETLKTHCPQFSLVVGSVDSLNNFVLPKVYQAISHHATPIKLEVRTAHSVELYSEVEKRQVDVAFVLHKIAHPNVRVTKCFTSPMVVLRLAAAAEQKADVLHPSDLDPNYELYMPWGRGPFQTWHERWWNTASSSQIKLDSTHLLIHLLQDPVQWAIVPTCIASEVAKQGNYFIYRLTDPPPNYTCYKLTHENPTSFTRRALDIFDEYFDAIVRGKL
jgi:DNA-binding transcriptional LysR family regulator